MMARRLMMNSGSFCNWIMPTQEDRDRVMLARQPSGSVTDTISTPADTYPGGYAYAGGVLLPDGRVFCVPYDATTARIYGAATYSLPDCRVLSAFDNKL